MKKIPLIFCLIVFAHQGFAKTTGEVQVQKSRSWNELQLSMEKLRQEDGVRGWSYILSGSLVTLGGLAASQSANESTTKLVYGITSSAGVAAVVYGIAQLSYGNDFSSFYDSLRDTNLSETQRDSLVRSYMQKEQDRRDHVRRMQMIGHLIAGTMNLYSAATEKDQNAKTFFSVLAGVNIALGVSYAF